MKDNKSNRLFIFLIGLILLLSISSIGFATIPETISYQGYLTDNVTGNPIDSLPGTISITFSIYDVVTGGDCFMV